MPTEWTSNVESAPRPAAPGRRRLLALAALGLSTAVACSGRDRARTVDADLGHDLELASTTGIELANRGGRGTQVVSAIEETPRSAPRMSAAVAPRSMGRRRHKVAKPAPEQPATVMVPDHESVAAAATESAAGTETVATAPAHTPDPGPQVQADPVSYPAGGGTEVGSGDHGSGGGRGDGGGVVVRGGMGGGIDPCDERDGHGRHRPPGGIGGILFPGGGLGGMIWGRGRGGTVSDGGGGSTGGSTGGTSGRPRWPSRAGRWPGR